jgi:nucleoid DNA-binding protein
MKITKKEFYKLLSPHTRGWLDAQQWNNAFAIILDVLGKELKNGNIIYTDIGTFEIRKPMRKVRGFKDNEAPVYEKRKEIKYTRSDKLKEIMNGRNK